MIQANELRIGEQKVHGYEIHMDGTIISQKTGRAMKETINAKGYPCITLTINGKPKFYRIHRLLAELFIPNPENKPFVNHKDRDRTNYSLDNLEWVTAQENVVHSVLNGGRKNYKRDNKGSRNANSRLSELHVSAIMDLIKIGYSQEKLAIIFDVTQSTISKISNNKLWKQVV